MLFQLISHRYQNKSTLITTNRAFGEWNEIACVGSLVDRLVHYAEIVAIEGESYAQGSPRPRRCPGTQTPRRQVMSTMLDHLRPITVEIPVTWTPEQALAV